MGFKMTGQQLYESLGQLNEEQRKCSVIAIISCQLPISECNYDVCKFNGFVNCVECGPNSGPLGELKEYPYIELIIKR